jgi:chloramphenicol O-acetyltransferase type A
MKKIDVATWERKQVFNFYEHMDVPMYNMTFELDVTRFYRYVKANNQSFYFTFMHLVMKEMNKIENFKYRFVDDTPYVFDTVHPSFTDLINGKESFKIVTIDYVADEKQFIELAKKASDDQGDTFIDLSEEVRDDLVYITTFPWATYQQVSFAHNINHHDAVPRLTWGKYHIVNDRKVMPFSIGVHHAFVDGFHVGKLINNLQSALDAYIL